MPIYDYRCEMCGIKQGIFKRIAELDLEEPCDACGKPMARMVAAPAVRGDYEGYACPITGCWIEGRRAHQENLAKHGCRLLEPGEKEHADRVRAEADAKLDADIGNTVDEEISRMPARKRESLAAEMEAGVDAQVVRTIPN